MPPSSPTRQPFINGRPVRGAEFIGRAAQLQTIFNRLYSGESTAVVGEPHIGKSSLLLRLAHSGAQKQYLGEADAPRFVIKTLDLHPIGSDYTPKNFWEEVLEPVSAVLEETSGTDLLEQAVKREYSRGTLERLFNHLGEQNRRLCVLLDEFDVLLNHANFNTPAFFALLRSLSTRTGGLALVTASRLSVAEMNERGHASLDTGSPFFNNMIEVRLRPFDAPECEALFNCAGDALTPADRVFIRRVAGPHPFLLQALAATLMESTGTPEERHPRAAEVFYDHISYHFDDLWRNADDRTRTTTVILSLMDLGGQALGQSFSFGDIERVAEFGPELKELAERGWAERVGEGWQFDTQHLLLWQGERWTVSAQGLTWWVRDVAIAGTRPNTIYSEWLEKKHYTFLLTDEQWQHLNTFAKSMPDWATQGVTGVAKMLLKSVLTKALTPPK